MPDIKKKRKAMSIQDTANGVGLDDSRTVARRRSSYSGPKKAPGSTAASRNAGRAAGSGSMFSKNKADSPKSVKAGQRGSTYVNTVDGYGYAPMTPVSDKARAGRAKSSGGYVAPSHAEGIMDYAWIPYMVILAICLTASLIVYSRNAYTMNGIYVPRQLFTHSGILNTIYDEYFSGGLGMNYTGTDDAAGAITDAGTEEGVGTTTGTIPGSADAAGTDSTALPNSTTGATMALDDGSVYGTYTNATTHEEVVEQLSQALSAGDSGFVGRKLAYTDEGSGQLIGYPQSVVEHFTEYMSANAEKKESFISEISGEDYAADYNGAQVIKLPLIKFTVNMGYDDTTLSISGFSDQVLNSGQSATVSPLLPCMYTISVTTSGGSQSSEVEANMNEGNLQINIGVTDQPKEEATEAATEAADGAGTDTAETEGATQ